MPPATPRWTPIVAGESDPAFHNGDPPRVAVARLVAVAEIAEAIAEREPLGGVGQAVEHRRRGGRQHPLPDAVRDGFAELGLVEGEAQDRCAGAAVGRLVRGESLFDGDLRVATDDASPVAA